MSLMDGFSDLANLDDKKFDDILNEARALLARYGKEWTDHNITDPGITFIELFAWLAEMQMYYLNQVTDTNYKTFLKLLGIHPLRAQSARVDITFENIPYYKTIKAGEQLYTELGTEKIVFEVEEDITLIPVKIKSIITTFDSRIIDNTKANEKEKIYFAAFGERAPKGAALKLGFDKSFPGKKTSVETSITFELREADLIPAGKHFDEPALEFTSAKVVWEYNSNGKWKELPAKKDTTMALTRSGRVVFGWPSDITAQDNGLYWIQCRLKEGTYEIAPIVDSILLNIVPAVQVERITKDLGTGMGIPDMAVQLENIPFINRIQFAAMDIPDWNGLLQQFKSNVGSTIPPPEKKIYDLLDQRTQALIDGWKKDKEPDDALKNAFIESLNKILELRNLYDFNSFKNIPLSNLHGKFQSKEIKFSSNLEIMTLNRFLIEAVFPENIEKNRLIIQTKKANADSEYWYEVDDFESSCPEDTHYIFDKEKNGIIFGNGLNGRIPVESERIKAAYKITMGPRGNIPENHKFLINGCPGFSGINFKASTGGKDPETLDEAINRAKRDCREIYRAITSEDYEYLALSTPGLRVARAKVLPNYYPELPLIKMPDTVTVVAVPYMREESFNPIAGRGFLTAIQEHLNRHRLITTNVQVIGPTYVKITINCTVHIEKGRGPEKIEKDVKEKLNDFLSPVNKKGTGWPFGRAVYPSEIHKIINEVEGVDYISDLSLIDDKGQYHNDIVNISPVSIVYPGEHQLKMIGA